MIPNGVVDISGQRFGRLLVEAYVGKGYGGSGSKWRCICDCGQTVDVPAVMLKTKAKQSCGCLRKETIAAKTLPSGIASRNQLYWKYANSAKRRRLEFGLTINEFAVITKSQCQYCGVEPRTLHPPKMTTGRDGGSGYNGYYVYNGIDRLDSNQGYNSANVVACCSICNRAKSTLTVCEFEAWVARLVAFRIKQQPGCISLQP